MRFHQRLHLDKRHVVEHHLTPVHRPLVEHLGRDVLRLDVDPFRFRLVEHVGEQAHLELEAEQVDLGDALLPAFQDDFLDEQPRDRQVDRADDDHPPRLLAVEGAQAVRTCRG